MSTWWEYVTQVGGGASQAVIARRTNLSPATVSRWQGSEPHPRNVAAFALAYGRPVLEAFVAAGFLTDEQAKAQVIRADARALTDDELLGEVRARMAHRLRAVVLDDRDPVVVTLRAAGLSDEAIAEALRGREQADTPDVSDRTTGAPGGTGHKAMRA